MENQRITIETIETKEFHVAARGYNQHEVDEFLDSICDEFERLEAEMAALREENDRLKNQALPQTVVAAEDTEETVPVMAAPVAPVQTPEGTFREILEMAIRVKDQTIADAQAKAEEIVENAQVQVQARLGNLNEEKDALEAKVESLKNAAQEYKTKFADLLSLAKDALDAADEL